MDHRLTYEKPNGEWGLKGHDFGQVPGELYGFFCKLHAYEKSGLTPDQVEGLKTKKEEYAWVPCSKALPPEPVVEAGFTEADIEGLVASHILKEYLVTICGADEPTTLVYVGSGEWFDVLLTEEYYKVAAWMPMPEVFKDNAGAV